MRYGYKIIHEEDDDYSMVVKDHTNVLAATMNIVQWQLCRQDFMKGFFNRAEIINTDNDRVLHRVNPDKEISKLELEREENCKAWDIIRAKLPAKGFTSKGEYTKIYIELSPVLDAHKAIDERIITDIAKRIKEIIKGL